MRPRLSDTPGRGPGAFERAFSRLAAGDRGAAPEVFAYLWPRLLRFSQRAVGADAEDCAQRALMTLFDEISTFDPARSPLAWAYAIAVWECRTIQRTRSRSRELVTDSVDVAGDAVDAEVAAEERDLVRRALALVSSLSALDRRTLEDEMLDRVAASTTHRQRRHRMLERLRAAFRSIHGP